MFSFRKRINLSSHRLLKKRQNRRLFLFSCPQKKGVCRRVGVLPPKKPNSARRKIARVLVLSAQRAITVYIPGIGHNLQSFSVVLFRGGRVQDLPGVKYKVIRGAFDCLGVVSRKRARSKYGLKRLKKVKVGFTSSLQKQP